MRGPKGTAKRGAIAGVLAATALAVWFLAIDALEGRPLYTPTFLASVLLGLERPEATVPLIAGYTVLHYGVFVLLGIGVAAVLSRLEAAPGFLLGVVVGFLLFDLVFYLSVVVTGVNVVRVLGWPEVLTGNLLAGVVLMAYLHLTQEAGVTSWRALLREHRVIREGLLAGAVGALAVAAWFLVVDLLRGQLFFTPAALGSALFFGARGVAEVQLTAPVVLGYTFVHFAAFGLVGLVAAALAVEAEREPPLLLGFVLLFVTFETLFIGLMAIVALWLLDALDWWNIAIANLVAAGAMGGYLWREHPKLQRELRQPLEEPV